MEKLVWTTLAPQDIVLLSHRAQPGMNSSQHQDSTTLQYKRPCGLMDKAVVFGTKDCRFESCQGQQAWLLVQL